MGGMVSAPGSPCKASSCGFARRAPAPGWVGGTRGALLEAMSTATLAAHVLERKNDLEDALADLGPHDVVARQAIETALATIYPLITGDLAHLPDVVARRLSRWLERNRHLALDITRRQRAERALRYATR